MSGTISKHTVFTPEGKVTTRVIAKVINGKQKIYLQRSTPRSTPISENEIRQRNVFAAASAYWTQVKKDEYVLNLWANNHKQLPEGKNYKTLSGYVIASAMKFFKMHPEELDFLNCSTTGARGKRDESISRASRAWNILIPTNETV